MAQRHAFYVLAVVLQLLLVEGQQVTVQEDVCPTATRPHMTRCDQYYRCSVLSKDAHVWVATQCQKGLVYLHNLGTCVVPDNDWECDLSAEKEQNHSEENVYGIDNLKLPSLPSNTNSDSEEQSEETQTPATSWEDHTRSVGSSLNDQNDLESSGDGSPERVSDEVNTAAPLQTSTLGTKSSTSEMASTVKSSDSLNASQLGSFLAYYDTQNALKLKTKPVPLKMDEQNYLDRLKQIVSQQKQLNEMARIPSNENFLSYKPVAPVQQQTKKKEPETEDAVSKLNLTPGMQEIIKSILDISQKAIANQKQVSDSPVAASQVKDPVVKPILIPISVNPVPVPNLQQPPTTTEQPLKPNFQSKFNPTSFDLSLSNLAQSTISNGLRISDTNDTMFHTFPQQQVLYDAYGNRFIPKDAYQPVSASYPSPAAYNSFLNPSPPQSSMLINDSPLGAYYSTANGRPSLRVPPFRYNEPLSYFHQTRPSFQRINPPVSDYDSVIDREKPLESIESIETDSNSSLEKDLPLPAVNRHSESDGSQEDGPIDSAETQYKRKLFTLGDTTFDYEQYKDSMLPLLDANPDDERISVVLCMVGSRQPNNTDCFRYYICNPHNGMFQSYTCPPSTAFNKKSRMCDLTSYKQCKEQMTPAAPVRPQLRTHKQPPKTKQLPTTNGMDQIKQELRKAQKYVEMIRLEANRLHLRNGVRSPPSSSDQKVIFLPSLSDHRRPATSKVERKEVKKKSPAAKQPVKMVPRCRLEGRMPDPMDQSNYYVCHRKSPNKFIKLKMACPAELVYCADTQYCTLRSNC